MTRLYKLAGIAVGVVFLLFTQLHQLALLPGLHFDEAWAMNFAARIATEPGFWPLTAMSPYTAPWAHYWAALWFRLLGPSLFAFRFSQALLSLAGLAALAAALPRHLRSSFPWAALLLPGLLLNHRFAIELNGLHVLGFGLLCLGLRQRWPWLSVGAALVASTGHILFYGACLGLLGAVLLERRLLSRAERAAGISYFGAMLLFFLRVAALVPEKGKAGALLLSALLAASLLAAGAERWAFWPRLRPLAALASIVFLANAFFFAQGYWGGALFTGYFPDGWLLPLVLLGAGGLFLVIVRGWAQAPRFLRTWLLVGTTLLGLMMLKPAPRYFELTLLGLAALVTWDLADWIYLLEWPLSPRTHRLTLLAGVAAINLGLVTQLVYFLPPREAELRVLAYKDSSRDFLDKQGLVRFLGGSGCAPDDIQTHDPRLLEELQALRRGDWPVAAGERCPWDLVARRAEGPLGDDEGEFTLRRRTWK